MNYNVRNVVAEIASERKHMQTWKLALIMLSFIMVLCISFALISPASALESQAEAESETNISEETLAAEETVGEFVEEKVEDEFHTEQKSEEELKEALPTENEEQEKEILQEEEKLGEDEIIPQFLTAFQAPMVTSDPVSPTNSILLEKKNDYDSNTDQYVITIEAALDASGSDTTTLPNDIILVLDKSGSMAYDVTFVETEEKIVGDLRNDRSFLDTLDRSKQYYVEVVERGGWGDYTAPLRFRNGRWEWKPRLNSYQSINTKPGAGKLGRVFLPESTVTVEKVDILRKSVLDFLGKLKENAKKYDVEHRVDIVTFDTGAREAYSSYGRYNSTPYGFLKINATDSDDYEKLIDIVSGTYNGVDNLYPNGGTDHDRALEKAIDIMKDKTKVRSDSVKSVVLFTDGEPDANRDSDEIRRRAIEDSYKLIHTYGANVYTIGLFDSTGNSLSNARKLVDLISSDYPEAEDMNYKPYPSSSEKKYSFSQTSGDTLVYNFGTVADTILGDSTITIDNQAFIKDIVTSDFSVVDVKVYDKDAYGTETLNTGINIYTSTDASGQTTVKVGNFELDDYDKNTKSLLVKIYTTVNGTPIYDTNEVYSNDVNSGIYKSETDVIKLFDNPKVEVYDFSVRYVYSNTDIASPKNGFLLRGTKLQVSATDIDKYVKGSKTEDIVSETNTNVIFYYTPYISDTNITYTSTDYGKVRLLSPTDSILEKSVKETGKIGSAPSGAIAVPDPGCKFIEWRDEEGNFVSSNTNLIPEKFVNETSYVAVFEPDVYEVVIENTDSGIDADGITTFEVVIANISSTDFITYTSLASGTDVKTTTDSATYTFKLHTKGEKDSSITFTVPNNCTVTVTETEHDGYYVSHEINNTGAVAGDKSVTITVEGDNQLFVFINKALYYELPHTGGIGVDVFTTAGLAIIVISVSMLIYFRKRKLN